MITRYQTLFQIDLRHAFYTENLAKELVLAPTPGTQKVMRQYDLLLKVHDGSFKLIYGTEAGNSPALAYLNGILPLRFVLRNTNPYFLNITDIPFFNTQSRRFYFHNLGKSAPQGDAVSLSVQGTVGEDDLLSAKDPVMNMSFEASDLGIVELYVGHDGNALIAPPSPDPALPRPETNYFLSFAARSTRWRYHIVNKSQLNYHKMDVLDGRTPLVFREGTPRMLRGLDYEATPLLSDASFMLQERQPVKPKLKLIAQNANGASSDLFTTIDLPTPDWKRISPQGLSGDQQVYSDMYVFL